MRNKFIKVFRSLYTEESYFNESRINNLFHGDNSLFKELLLTTKVYYEYGSGFSTIYASRLDHIEVNSIDTNLGWIEELKKHIKSDVNFIHVDLGEINRFGAPKSFEKINNFNNYVNAIYTKNNFPQLILIDGRFRINCLLTALKKCPEGTFILFDDYLTRPHYHIVEKFEKPIEFDGRQALFKVKKNYNFDELDNYINKFEVFYD